MSLAVRSSLGCWVLRALCANTVPSYAIDGQALLGLDLEQLMNMEVTTASRKSQSLSHTSAAAFVITQEDMRRSGATSLPEALRLAPGVEVGQISASKWSVTIRGFNGRFAGKLLVLIDGRSVYTPSFSGVYWEMHSPLLEDIERIEVIRGPGATLSGANAVNGIINIITRPSQDTQGGEVNLVAGNQQQLGSARWGGQISDAASYRAYAKVEHENAQKALDSTAVQDDFERYQIGLRSDWGKLGDEHYILTAEAAHLLQGESLNLPDVSLPSLGYLAHTTADIHSGHVLGHWEKALALDSDISVQAYVDSYDRNSLEYDESSFTANLDIQHHLLLGKRHDLVWGAAYRHSTNSVNSQIVFDITPNNQSLNIFSAFMQDEIELLEDKLWLVAGIKAEDSEYSNLEWQPNLRLLWTPSHNDTLWASVARAVRLPSRADRSVEQYKFSAQYITVPMSPFPMPLLLAAKSDPDFQPEEVLAYELGYRTQLKNKLLLDIALYYNTYDQLRDVAFLGMLSGTHFLYTNSQLQNTIKGSTQGVELAIDWQPNTEWRWQLAYNLMDMNLKSDLPLEQILPPGSASSYEQGSPMQQLSLRSSWRVQANINADAWLRYVGAAPMMGALGGSPYPTPDYLTLDMRLAWSPTKHWEWALIGKNLLSSSHLEAVEEFWRVPTEIQRSLMATMRWTFE